MTTTRTARLNSNPIRPNSCSVCDKFNPRGTVIEIIIRRNGFTGMHTVCAPCVKVIQSIK